MYILDFLLLDWDVLNLIIKDFGILKLYLSPHGKKRTNGIRTEDPNRVQLNIGPPTHKFLC